MTWEELKPVHDGRKSFWGRAHVARLGDGTVLLESNWTTVACVDASGRFHRMWSGWSCATGRHLVEFAKQFATDGTLPHKRLWDGLPVEEDIGAIQRTADLRLLSLEAKA